MTKPHAQRASIATGIPVDEVREWIADGDYESTEDLIEALEHHLMLDAAWEYAESTGESFDHVMGRVLAGF